MTDRPTCRQIDRPSARIGCNSWLDSACCVSSPYLPLGFNSVSSSIRILSAGHRGRGRIHRSGTSATTVEHLPGGVNPFLPCFSENLGKGVANGQVRRPLTRRPAPTAVPGCAMMRPAADAPQTPRKTGHGGPGADTQWTPLFAAGRRISIDAVPGQQDHEPVTVMLRRRRARTHAPGPASCDSMGGPPICRKTTMPQVRLHHRVICIRGPRERRWHQRPLKSGKCQ